MRADDDRKASALIRDTAMALFGQRGVAAVSLRRVAAAAGVSPSLVVHHYRSKDGLKAAVDQRVVEFVDLCLEELVSSGDEGAAASFAELWAQRLEQFPGMTDYVGRLLVDGGEMGDSLFDRLFEATFRGVSGLAATGAVRQSDDERARAAFLLANDLAVVLLRAQIGRVIGADPLCKAGLARWCAVCADVYAQGLLVAPQAGGAAAEREVAG